MKSYAVLALGLMSLPLRLAAQGPAETHINVTGTVVNGLTGAPISGALVIFQPGPRQVTANPPQNPDADGVPLSGRFMPQDSQRLVTDEGGAFSFSAFPTASLVVQASRRGYRTESGQDIAQVRLTGPAQGAPVVLKLLPLSTIEGRVVNSDGEAVRGLAVEAVRVEIRDGRRQLTSSASKNTNDLGEYRLWYLTPGTYLVKVVGRRGTYVTVSGLPRASQSEEAYGPVYFPAADNQEAAQSISLAGGETFHADFKVDGKSSYTIRGQAIHTSVTRRTVARLLRGDDSMGNRAVINGSTGAFQVLDVTPGTYTLQIYTADAGTFLFGETQVTVGDKNLSGVSLTLNPGVDLPVEVEGAGEAGPALQITATPAAPGHVPNAVPVFAFRTPDGFSLKNLLPGRYDVQVTPFGGEYVSAVTSGDVDVLAEGLTVGTSAPPALKVQLSPGAGTITGTIEGLGSGETAEVALVRNLSNGAPPRIIPNIIGGKFRVSGLAPGVYSIYAWRSTQPVEYRNPAVLSTLTPGAADVTVEESATQDVTVHLKEGQKQ